MDVLTVETSTGPVVGTLHPKNAHVRRFEGIPYAAPPVGELFLKWPQPHKPWSEPLVCTGPAPTAQRRHYHPDSLWKDPIVEGESILNLTVTAPVDGEDLPVLVWIHGGGFKSGSANSPITDPVRFAAEGVVVFSIAYRLGVEGFAHLPGTDPNRGLVDQQAALKWIQANAAAFGGSSQRVTIAGQSAGGGSVLAHLVAPASAGLFRRAISMSGVLPALDASVAGERAELFLHQLSARGVSDFTAMTRQAVAAELETENLVFQHSPDPVEFVRGRARREPLSDLPFMPFQEPQVLPLGVEEGVARGLGDEVDLLMTHTSEEFTDICLPFAHWLDNYAAEDLFQQAAVPWRERYRRAAQAGTSTSLIVGMMLDDVFFPDLVAELSSYRAQRGVRTYSHVCDWCPAREGNGDVPAAQRYARHCMDIPFVFDTVHTAQARLLVGENPPAKLVEENHQLWLDFVRRG
ncbi:MAG: carboxylesterase family protein [Actinomycetaceae bacterium]|nr:carboxylesterase family protein [Actinomycetaceae bacterium]